jgi:hypothetical protein
MPETDIILLTDKNIYPTDDHIFSLIGEKKIYWKQIINHIATNYKDSTGSWNFYNDGKRWLFKMVNKKKTIFWAAILSDTFRLTFYFGDKAEHIIDESDLPQTIKDGFKTVKRYGLIRPVSFLVNDKADVDNVIKLIEIKHKLK